MLGKGLVFLSVLVGAVAVVFQSVPAAIAAGVLGIFGVTSQSFK